MYHNWPAEFTMVPFPHTPACKVAGHSRGLLAECLHPYKGLGDCCTHTSQD